MLDDEGPLMLAATDVLRPPQARIAKIGPSLTLPRSVPIRSVVAGAAGLIIGLPVSLLGWRFVGLQAFFFLSIAFVLAGVFVVQWQPQKGETLLQILGVRARTAMRQQRVEIDGVQMSLSIGVARISRVNAGPCRIVPGAVEVDPTSVDERGVIRSAKNKNLLPLVQRGYTAFPDATGPAEPSRLQLPNLELGATPVAAPPAPGGRSLALPDDTLLPPPAPAAGTPPRSRLPLPEGLGLPPADPQPAPAAGTGRLRLPEEVGGAGPLPAPPQRRGRLPLPDDEPVAPVPPAHGPGPHRLPGTPHVGDTTTPPSRLTLPDDVPPPTPVAEATERITDAPARPSRLRLPE